MSRGVSYNAEQRLLALPTAPLPPAFLLALLARPALGGVRIEPPALLACLARLLVRLLRLLVLLAVAFPFCRVPPLAGALLGALDVEVATLAAALFRRLTLVLGPLTV